MRPFSAPGAPSHRRTRSILHRRNKPVKARMQRRRSSSDDSLPTGENQTLSGLLSATSISSTSSNPESSQSNRTGITNFLRHQASTTTLGANNNQPAFPNLPFEPVLRAGILIIVTSPEGVVSLGVVDGESTERGHKHGGKFKKHKSRRV
ncbi:hypothetical protein FQN57_006177 [Myotisia sp. PD_48]|nr:hypothetical protein FQN57_006177 [Myotisia sp. PD_48]